MCGGSVESIDRNGSWYFVRVHISFGLDIFYCPSFSISIFDTSFSFWDQFGIRIIILGALHMEHLLRSKWSPFPLQLVDNCLLVLFSFSKSLLNFFQFSFSFWFLSIRKYVSSSLLTFINHNIFIYSIELSMAMSRLEFSALATWTWTSYGLWVLEARFEAS